MLYENWLKEKINKNVRLGNLNVFSINPLYQSTFVTLQINSLILCILLFLDVLLKIPEGRIECFLPKRLELILSITNYTCILQFEEKNFWELHRYRGDNICIIIDD